MKTPNQKHLVAVPQHVFHLDLSLVFSLNFHATPTFSPSCKRNAVLRAENTYSSTSQAQGPHYTLPLIKYYSLSIFIE